jgi:hypothetical protein
MNTTKSMTAPVAYTPSPSGPVTAADVGYVFVKYFSGPPPYGIGTDVERCLDAMGESWRVSEIATVIAHVREEYRTGRLSEQRRAWLEKIPNWKWPPRVRPS